MKQLGASSPHRDQLRDYSLALVNSRQTDRLFFIFLFNRKKTWYFIFLIFLILLIFNQSCLGFGYRKVN